MAETHFWDEESHEEGEVAFVTDKLSRGVHTPLGGIRETEKERRRGRVTEGERDGQRQSAGV